jgi:homoserine kinase
MLSAVSTAHDPSPARLALRVAGSTSNLGPGFDCLGLCLSLHLTVEVELTPGVATRVVRTGEPLDVAPGADLLVRAFDRGRALAGAAPVEAHYAVHSEIPFGRGFGSSGAAVAAGLVLGVRSVGADPGALRQRLVEAGLELEGHPDNVVASLHGGCTLGVPLTTPSAPTGDTGTRGAPLEVLMVPVHPSIGWAVAWPATPLPTPIARQALPKSVAFADAVENPRRLALLLRGLTTGAPRLLAEGVVDRLHERYRLPLIPGAVEALAAARRAGAWAATISGAGSGLVALGPLSARGELAAALAAELGPGAVGHAVDCVLGGALTSGQP